MNTSNEDVSVPLPPWEISKLFVPAASDHACCSCCFGYCPADDIADDRYERPDLLYAVQGRWISDRFVAVDSSMVVVPDDVEIDANVDRSGLLSDAPEFTGVESSAPFTPEIAVRLLDLGIFIQDEEGTLKAGGRAQQSLWYTPPGHHDPIHVGWAMPTRQVGNQPEPPTLPKIRRYQKILHGDHHPSLQGLVGMVVDLDPYRALAAIELTFGPEALENAK